MTRRRKWPLFFEHKRYEKRREPVFFHPFPIPDGRPRHAIARRCNYSRYPLTYRICLDKFWGEPGCTALKEGLWGTLFPGFCVFSGYDFTRVFTVVAERIGDNCLEITFWNRQFKEIKKFKCVDTENPAYLYPWEVR